MRCILRSQWQLLTPALRVPASQLSGEKAQESAGEPRKQVAEIEEAGSSENRNKARVDPFSNPPWSNPVIEWADETEIRKAQSKSLFGL